MAPEQKYRTQEQLQRALKCSTPNDWHYLAEGGANVIFAYHGRDESLLGMVLRLSKGKVDRKDPEGRGQLEFAQRVLYSLLSEGMICKAWLLAIEQGLLHGLAADSESVRPALRRNKDAIDLTRPNAVLVQDMTYSPVGHTVLSIEIKPKCGFLPSATCLGSSTKQFKTKYCRYCMHSLLKAHNKGETDLSLPPYCPIDLYSIDDKRRTKALEGLWDLWKTNGRKQNNLKLFINGQYVDHQDDAVWQQLIDALAASESKPTPKAIFLQLAASALKDSSVLQNLVALQQRFDPIDIEGINASLERQHGVSLFRDPESIHAVLSEHATIDEFEAVARENNIGDLSLRKQVVAYLLAATFKDCSLFIRTDLSTQSSSDIKLVDLDAKPVDRMSHYATLDAKIVQTFSQVSTGHTFDRTCA